MTPNKARILAQYLYIGSIILLIAMVPPIAYLVIDFFLPAPVRPKKEIKLWEAPKRKIKAPYPLQDYFWAIAGLKLLPDRPVLALAPKKKEPKKIIKPIKKIPVPFAWAGVMVHSDPDKSSAIILDKRNNKQILVYQKQTISGTRYMVEQITSSYVKIRMGTNEGLIKKPQNTLAKNGKKKKLPTSLAIYDKKITIIGNMDDYGLKDQDQIVAFEGNRIQDIGQLRKQIGRSEKSITRLSVLRKGKIVSVTLNKKILEQLAGMNQ